MICYLIFSVLIAAAAFTVRRRSLLRLTGAAFYAVQAAFAVRIVAGGLYGETSAVWFAFDAAGTLWLTVTGSDTVSGIVRTQALACLVLTGTALDGVSAVGLEETDGGVLHEPMTANDLALTDPATDTQS